MRLNIFLLAGFLSFNVFAQSHAQSNGEATAHSEDKKGASVFYSDPEFGSTDFCLKPETTLGDVGDSLTLSFHFAYGEKERRVLLPVGKDLIFIQGAKKCFKQSCIDRTKPYCVLKVSEKYVSKTSMQLVREDIKFLPQRSVDAKGLEHITDIDSSLSLAEPYEAIGCKGDKTSHTGALSIIEFKKIVGDSFNFMVNCKKLVDKDKK